VETAGEDGVGDAFERPVSTGGGAPLEAPRDASRPGTDVVGEVLVPTVDGPTWLDVDRTKGRAIRTMIEIRMTAASVTPVISH
jgi:hypothetical protein